MPNVSIVIPTYNEATYVGRLLADLAKQSFKDFEVIVSDAESKDGVAAVVKKFQKKLAIQLIESPPKGPAAGRNIGAAMAHGEWLIFMDADDTLNDPDFISKVLEMAVAKGWQTVSPKMKVQDASLIERFGTAANYYYTKLLAHTKHPVGAGWCLVTKRDVFEKHGGFNEKIQFGEDYDYVSRVSAEGFGFVESTYYILDLRRPREEGLIFVYKCIANEVYRHTHHYNLEKDPIKYEFGKHKVRQK